MIVHRDQADTRGRISLVGFGIEEGLQPLFSSHANLKSRREWQIFFKTENTPSYMRSF